MRSGWSNRAWMLRARAARVAAIAGLTTGLATLQAAPGAAEPPSQQRDLARRTVRVFDFEEPANPELVPAGWSRAQSQRTAADPSTLAPSMSRPGFPEFNRAEFDFKMAHTGNASVRLPTRGGSTSLRLEPGELPVYPEADYVLTAAVRTTELKHARAFVVARLLDQQLNPVPGSEVRSEPIVSSGAWTMVTVPIPGVGREAAWMQIELELLQPREFNTGIAGPGAQHELWREDVRADAWFDDIGLFQVPRAKIWTLSDSNIIPAAKPPTLWMLVRDLAGRPLNGSIRVFDTLGRTVATEQRSLDPDARAASWTPTLPGYGWYRAVLEVRSEADAVSRTELTFAHLSPPRARSAASSRAADAQRFGLIAERMPEDVLGQLPGIIRELGTGFVFLPAIDPSQPPERAADVMRGREPVYEALSDMGQRVTLSMASIPRSLARALTLDDDDAIGMCERPAANWYPYLEPTLDVYGQRLVRYQLGPSGDRHSLRRQPGAALSALEAALSRLVPDPSIALSWRADHTPPTVLRQRVDDPKLPHSPPVGPLIDAVTLAIPASFQSASILDITRQWLNASIDPAGAGPPEITVVPELPSAEQFGSDAPVIELVRRGVEFWAASSTLPPGVPEPRFAIHEPWRVNPAAPRVAGAVEQPIRPSPELPALHTMADQLGGRRVVSTLATAPGIRAYVLAAGAGQPGGLDDGCVIAWNESAAAQNVMIDIAPAGSSVTVCDVFGNPTVVQAPAPKTPGGAAPLLSIPVGESPVYIQGVDPYLAMFAASFRVEPPYVPATIGEHEHTLHLSNPWPVRISGKLQLRDSEQGEIGMTRSRGDDWSITPRGIIDFAIAPGESITVPMTITLGSRQIAGPRDFVVVARVNADRQYPPIRLKTPIEIGLPAIELIPEVRLSPTPEGPDVIVTTTITNKDNRSRVLRLEAAAAGQATQQQQVSDLSPGQSTLRRFVFKDAAKTLAGRRVFITLTEAEGAERLNKAVTVP